jgi:hypothetical protein
MKGTTRYSKPHKGDKWNWRRVTQFDVTDGYLGITQTENGAVVDRVLLTPSQVTALRDYIDNMGNSPFKS